MITKNAKQLSDFVLNKGISQAWIFEGFKPDKQEIFLRLNCNTAEELNEEINEIHNDHPGERLTGYFARKANCPDEQKMKICFITGLKIEQKIEAEAQEPAALQSDPVLNGDFEKRVKKEVEYRIAQKRLKDLEEQIKQEDEGPGNRITEILCKIFETTITPGQGNSLQLQGIGEDEINNALAIILEKLEVTTVLNLANKLQDLKKDDPQLIVYKNMINN